jgi:photosystem II stability/assembly factor-like uncharacterized protein
MADQSGNRFLVPHLCRILVLLWSLPALWAYAAVPQAPPGVTDSIRVVPGYVAIKFKADAALTGGAHVAAAVPPSLARCGVLSLTPMFGQLKALVSGKASVGRTDISGITLATIPEDSDPRGIAAAISQLEGVEYAEPRYLYPLLEAPNDSLLTRQMSYLGRMSVIEGWSMVKGDSSVIIATIDGGTDWRHEDLTPNLWINRDEDINHNGRFDRGSPPLGDEDGIDNDGNGYVDDVVGWNLAARTNDPVGLPAQPRNAAHGTITASQFGAATNNGMGIAGASWNCRILPVCAASPIDGFVEYGPEGIVYAYQNGASVINLSWGGYGDASRVLQEAITAATEAGTLVVAAAGNSRSDNDRSPFYPANLDHVLAVGATNSTDDAKAGFSNYGMTIPVFACGVGIWGARPNGDYVNAGEGTSYASPLVAGLAGLLKSAHPAWTPAQIAAQITMTSDNLDEVAANAEFIGKLGHGRVNFARALTEAGHVGIDIVKSECHSGFRTAFYPGDSLALSLTVQNVLTVPATNLQFNVTCLDGSIDILKGNSTPITLQPGDEAVLPDFACEIAPHETNTDDRTALIRVDWVANGNERDYRVFKIDVNSTRPTWMIQESVPSVCFRSVKGVNRGIAWVAGGGSGSLILRTLNTGVMWDDVTGGLNEGMLNCVDAYDGLHAWVGSDSGKIVGTTDGGMNWMAHTYPGRQSSALCGIRFLDHLNGFVLGNPPANQAQFVLLKTTDGGTTWSHLASEPTGVAGEYAGPSSLCWLDANHGWFGTSQSRVWRTTDGGRSWSAASTGLPVEPSAVAKPLGVVFLDSLRGQAYHSHPDLARSMDGGSSWVWSYDLSATGAQSAGAIAAMPGSSWILAGTNRSVLRSTNGGAAWTTETVYPIRGTIDNLSGSATILGGNVFYTGWGVTDRGEVLRAEYSMKGIASSPGGSPKSYTLFQNYPNPANPSATIPYYIPNPSHVIIDIFNTLGQHVATLQNGQQEPGFHEVQFDGNPLASGVYFYRMEVRDPLISYGQKVVQTCKLLLLH